MNKREREKEKKIDEAFNPHSVSEKAVLDAIEFADDPFFEEFLKKVDRTPEMQLIEELFGSAEAYIDTPGDWRKNGESDIVYYVGENSDTLIQLYGWYCSHWRKAWDWVHARKKHSAINEQKIEEKSS